MPIHLSIKRLGKNGKHRFANIIKKHCSTVFLHLGEGKTEVVEVIVLDEIEKRFLLPVR